MTGPGSGHLNDAGITDSGTTPYSRTAHAVQYLEGTQGALDIVDADNNCRNFADATNIENTITNGERGQMLGFLEPRDIPAKWITAGAGGHTRREIVKGLCAVFYFAQRFKGLHGVGLPEQAAAGGITLTQAWPSIPLTFQNELLAARDDHGWTTPDPIASTTFEDFLIEAAANWVDPVVVGGFVL